MGLARGDLRNFEKDIGARKEMFDLPLEAIDLVDQFRRGRLILPRRE